jgi:hypothetical protein
MMVRVIRDDSNDSSAGCGVCFTPERATAMLPLVRRIVTELRGLSDSIEARRAQLRGVDQLRETSKHPSYQEELSDIRATIAEEEQRLLDCLRELAALGVEPHLPFDGYVDFPALLNRRSVRLCWGPDDDAVTHWHENGERAEQRQEIKHQSFSAGTLN